MSDRYCRPRHAERLVRWPGPAVSMPGCARAFRSACPGCREGAGEGGWAGARAVLLGNECLEVRVAVPVGPAGHAVTGWEARHGGDLSCPALVQGLHAGHVDRLVPGAVVLADHERLASRAIGVQAAGGAVARRGT